MPSVRALSTPVAGLVAIVLLATGCGPGGSSAQTPPPPDGPRLTVGIKYDQPGLGLRTGDGKYHGLDVDVAAYVARELGVDPRNVNFVETRSADRETVLEQRKVDMVAATYSITDQRKLRVDFAGPYFVAGQSLLVRHNNSDISGPESLDYSDWKLCSVTGSTPAQKVKDTYAKNVTLQEFASYKECVDALDRGEVDAVTTDDVILAGYAAAAPDRFKLVGKPFSIERYGIGLHKDDGRRTKIATALRKMVSDGSWKRFVADNLGRSGYKAPPPPEVVDAP